MPCCVLCSHFWYVVLIFWEDLSFLFLVKWRTSSDSTPESTLDSFLTHFSAERFNGSLCILWLEPKSPPSVCRSALHRAWKSSRYVLRSALFCRTASHFGFILWLHRNAAVSTERSFRLTQLTVTRNHSVWRVSMCNVSCKNRCV